MRYSATDGILSTVQMFQRSFLRYSATVGILPTVQMFQRRLPLPVLVRYVQVFRIPLALECTLLSRFWLNAAAVMRSSSADSSQRLARFAKRFRELSNPRHLRTLFQSAWQGQPASCKSVFL